MRSLSALLVLATATAVGACTFNPSAGNGTLSGVGTGNGGSTGNPGTAGRGGSLGTGRGGTTGTGTGGGTPTEDANCGVQSQAIQNVPPDLLIVLDRSGSMEQLADGSDCAGANCAMNKWAQMTAAINQVVVQTDTTIRWGLKYFANSGTCGITANAAVAPNIMTGQMIVNNINGTNTGGSTPTRLAVASASAYLSTLTDTNPKFILLATDGLPNCAPGAPTMQDDSAGAVAAIGAALTAGFPTFVVGIGMIAANGTVDPMQVLRQYATAGGRAPTAAPGYYQVNTTADLVAVLGTIQGMVASCQFSLTPPPPAPTNIAVHADANSIPKDTGHTNGWDYNGTCTSSQPCSIQLYGSWCDRVMAKEFQNVQALYGCPDGPPVP